MKLIIKILCAVLLLLAIQEPAFATATGSVNNAMNGVARVYVELNASLYNKEGEYQGTDSSYYQTGSAFAVGKQGEQVTYFVTNRHVISSSKETVKDKNGDEYTIEYNPGGIYIIMDNVPTKWRADVVTDNADGADLAILKLRQETKDREACVLRPYDNATKLVGSSVWAIGYPGISDELYKKVETNDDKLMSGIDNVRTASGNFNGEVDAAYSNEGGSVIETNVTISGGYSGGPLVDEKGAVLGVCTSGSVEVVGTNGAISINEVIKLLDQFSIPYVTDKDGTDWYVYIILGAAIAAVIAVMIVALKKKKNTRTKKNQEQQKESEDVLNRVATPNESRILIGISGPLANKRYELRENSKLIIGRDPNQCNVVFPDGTPGVSRIHCSVSFDGKVATIMDLKSAHGTFVDQKKLAENTAVRLHRGLSIDVGSEKNRFTLQ